MRIVLVHNRKAGKGKVPKKDLHDMLEKAGYDIVRAKPGSQKFHEGLEDAKLVVAAGGDGAVTKVALALRSTDPPIAIVPLGTANNIARALGVPHRPRGGHQGMEGRPGKTYRRLGGQGALGRAALHRGLRPRRPNAHDPSHGQEIDHGRNDQGRDRDRAREASDYAAPE